MASPWTDEKIAFLVQKWILGDTAAQIAERIGVTRNAVIGKVSRLKLEQRKATPKPKKQERKPPTLVAKPSDPKICTPREIAWPKPVVVVAPTRPIHSKRVTIFELDRCMCRAPLWGTHENLPIERKFYCGLPTDGGSWCIEHHTNMFGQGTSYERNAHILEGVAA